MGKREHSVSQLQTQRRKMGEYYSKSHDEVTIHQKKTERLADQSKWGFEQDSKSRYERRKEQREEQRARKRWLKAQQQAQQSAMLEPQEKFVTKTELNHKQKLHVAGKQQYHEHKKEKIQQNTEFLRSLITVAATAQFMSTVILPAAAQMNMHSLNSRESRPYAPKVRITGSVNTTQTRVFDVANLDGSNGYRLSPQANFSGSLPGRAGESVAVIKSATGYGNVLVGSPGQNKVGTIGRADMVYSTNQAHSAVVPLYNHSDNTGARFDSQAYGNGQNVKDIGDFDGDRNRDFLVTARYSAAAPMAIVYGTENGTFPAEVNLDTMTSDQGLHVMQTDPRSNDGSPIYLQTSADRVGDLNQDGKADVLFPGCADPADKRDTRGTDNSCLLYGTDLYRKKGVDTVDLSTVSFDGKQATLIYPVQPKNYRGTQPLSTASALGDVTGDDMDDFVEAFPYDFNTEYNENEAPEGKAVVFKGQKGGLPGIIKQTAQYLQQGGGFVFFGSQPGAQTGRGLTGDFDYNQDGHRDIGIGAPGAEEVKIVYGPLTKDRFPGSQTLLGNLTAEQGVTVHGECDGDGTGFALAPTGDFYNGDTHGGLGIGTEKGAKAFVLSSTSSASAEVYLGSLSPEEGVKFIDSEGSSTFGYAVAAGKIGDDKTVVVIGDPQMEAFEGPGRGASVVLGAESLPTETSNSQCPVVVPTSSSSVTSKVARRMTFLGASSSDITGRSSEKEKQEETSTPSLRSRA